MMSALEREMDHLFVPAGRNSFGVTFKEEADSLVLKADLPGLDESDVEIALENDVLTLKAQRKSHAPEGARVVRAERGNPSLAQRYELPCRVDAEATSAAMKDGVLTITLPKAKEARARRIPIGEKAATDPKLVS
jgi:HSP20 family protein